MLEIMRLIAKRKIYSAYQPIIDALNDTIVGYEALARNAKKIRPGAMFNSAAACGLLRELDVLCIESAIENTSGGEPVFINVLPYTLIWLFISGKLPGILDKAKPSTVFEIVESEQAPNDLTDLLLAVEMIRKRGFKIAIDDISQGFGRLHAIALLRPDYIKVDRALFANTPRHCSVIKGIISMASEMGSVVIAEGVETEKEFDKLHSMGIRIYQGYYFARPGESYPRQEIAITGGFRNAQNWT